MKQKASPQRTMRHAFLFRLAFLFCLSRGLLPLAEAAPLNLRAEPAEVDFGSVAQQQALKAIVKLTNAGQEPVAVFSVTTDCDCTTASTEKTSLGPGEVTALAIKLETRGQTGGVRRMVIVHATNGDLAIPVKMSVTPATSVPSPVAIGADDFAAVTSRVQGWVDRGYYSGAAMLVAKDNQVIYARCFGNYTAETEVLIASAGKWLAAATMMSLVDEGKLALDDPAAKWLPGLKNDPKGRATIRQMFAHTSGYPGYQPADKPVDKYQTLTESVAHIVPLPPVTLPGDRFDYGGLAMQVAGRMAEIATGKAWETVLPERIARPLRMLNPHFTPVDQGGGHSPMLGGGARSTLHDYVNFLAMIANDGVFEGRRVLSAKAIVEMQADQVRGAQVKREEFVERLRGQTHNGIYGLGEWREQLDEQGRAVLISSPSWAGAYPWIDKTCGVYGVILTHVSEDPAVARDKFSSFYTSPVLAPMVRDIVARAPSPRRHCRILEKERCTSIRAISTTRQRGRGRR